ncbi:MFS transporter [Pseudonocardia kunmingensis]|uniref:MFS transporter n=1 Tax=Pseudonocardia kunmingensis TaxID=630975 RepID=A0A543DPE1_9PSEU|nr:MFS transporter [Pseudonocardia kunmingensis]TQM11206.1 MFS transporter [Pseudonocardia kunmingensis]
MMTVRSRGLLMTLVYCGLCTSVVGSLGALLIPTIADSHDVPRGTAQWVLTAALLVGAIATPVLGALCDRPYRRTVLLATLATVLAGSVVAAMATSFPQLVVGRTMQGLTYGIIPMTMATARAHLPAEKVRGAVAALSITTVTGAGLSFPVTGLIVQIWEYHAAFWFAAGFTALALVGVAVATPRRDRSRPAQRTRLDLAGAVLLACALTSLLLAVSQGGAWGWSSPAVIGLAVAAVLSFTAWTWHELRIDNPLVQLRAFRHRDMAAANIAALGLGAMLFAGSSAVSQLVQTPVSAHYGFALTLLGAGLALLPTSIGSQLSNRLMRLVTRRLDPRLLLPLGPALVGIDMAFLALYHDELWQVLVGLFLQGLGIGVTFGAMPMMILAVVPEDQTGSATAMNQVLRTLGGSIGSAGTGALLASATPLGALLPTESGYTLTFVVAAAGCGALVALLVVMALLPAAAGSTAIAGQPPTPSRSASTSTSTSACTSTSR